MSRFLFWKFFFKIRFWTKMCIQKITFWLNLPRKLNEFCIFCAFFNSTILTQKVVLKSRFFNKILRVRFWIENFKTRTLLWKIISLEVSPTSTTFIFHNVFLHITMYSYSLQYLRQLDNSIRHRSNNTCCTHFRKDLDPRFCCCVPLFSLDKPDICRNKLLQVRLSRRTLGQFWSHTFLTSFWKYLILKKKLSIVCIYKTHTMYQIQTHTKFNETVMYTESGTFFNRFRMDDFSVIWGIRWDPQTLVLLLLELNSPCLPHRQLVLGWQWLIPSENRQKWM